MSAAAAAPIPERRGRQMHATALVDLRLPIHGAGVAHLAGDDLREQAGSGTGPPRWVWGEASAVTTPSWALLADAFLEAFLNDEELGRPKLPDPVRVSWPPSSGARRMGKPLVSDRSGIAPASLPRRPCPPVLEPLADGGAGSGGISGNLRRALGAAGC